MVVAVAAVDGIVAAVAMERIRTLATVDARQLQMVLRAVRAR